MKGDFGFDASIDLVIVSTGDEMEEEVDDPHNVLVEESNNTTAGCGGEESYAFPVYFE